MKNIVEFFKNSGIIFKDFKSLDLKEFKIKKRYKIFEGVDLKNSFVIVVLIDRKSRFLIKDALSLIEVIDKIIEKKEHSYKKKFLLISSPICSKALEKLQKEKIETINASL